MEFHEKLQELRKQKGITQEELAGHLYVSRTAVSKWESGRGYPGIDSLKAIAAFFSTTVDALLCTDEILTIANESQEKTASGFRDLLFGLLDTLALLLLFLPLFAARKGGAVETTSLLGLDGISPFLRITFFTAIIATALTGILTLALQGCSAPAWCKSKIWLSLALSTVMVLLFVVCLHPYAAVFSFALLAIKLAALLKRA